MASISLPDDFRVNHRAASESLLHAASALDLDTVNEFLDKAAYFETEAQRYITTNRQRALAMGLLHAVDLMRAVASAEFREIT